MDWAKHLRRVLVRLGEDVSYTHQGGGPVTVRGLFLAPYQSAVLGDHAAIASTNPRFVGLAADLALVARGDTILRASVTYTIDVVEPDDPSGLRVLELKAP